MAEVILSLKSYFCATELLNMDAVHWIGFAKL